MEKVKPAGSRETGGQLFSQTICIVEISPEAYLSRPFGDFFSQEYNYE